ncbi:MAG: hypothetical protein AVDCRST_MAG93-4968 [uncultured Chloroflexia bacterium]|uniref:Uncharacterized protein n=1 Tax=uncultured Chloroflexia bacterium TaxID=1672391 RepID=A0A6J4KJI2_9CHLR|nr:MAG: hypothetical protein AVDCRST_MAG93-4968 [uncultured Chloroflexia bacterium]
MCHTHRFIRAHKASWWSTMIVVVMNYLNAYEVRRSSRSVQRELYRRSIT